MRRFLSYGPGLLVLLTVMTVFLVGPVLIRNMQVARIEGMVQVAQHTLDNGNILEEINAANRAVADAALPSVVHIESRATRSDPDESDERFRFSAPTSGAGWVYDAEGHIITNAHVVANSNDARVEFFDGRVRRAEIVAMDEYTDVAVLRVDPGSAGVIPVRRATGAPLQIGEQVYAFGSPFGIKFSVTRGIVSGLGRTSAANLGGLRGSGYTNFIQTDAAINPGNSGGP
ncbi:MAG: trypsin-like peptidase domain-containing protein, partial [Phycisphaerales bacterium]|nr:trypsin-like peptidase domain-containing protein [Phycisphaerales bacterium]